MNNIKTKVFVSNDTLWMAYAEGSGTIMPQFSSKSYITTKSNDKNFDDIARKLVEYSQSTTPEKQLEKSKLFKIPIYAEHDENPFKKSKPKSYYYMLIDTSGVPVINFFKRKGEAVSFMQSSN